MTNTITPALTHAIQQKLPTVNETIVAQAVEAILRGEQATIASHSVSITFGDHNHFDQATITIGDIAGGHIIKDNTFIVQLPQPPLLPPPPLTPPPIPLHFVGRTTELALYQDRIRDHHSLILRGLAGVGKTALAAMVAYHTLPQTQIFWHTFRPGTTLGNLIPLFAGFLAMHGQQELWQFFQYAQHGHATMPSDDVLVDYVIQGLRQKPFLICLDDVQSVIDDEQLMHCVKQLYQQSQQGHLHLILTTRQALAFAPHSQTTMLSGLGLSDIHALLQELSIILPEECIEVIYQTTEGNSQLVHLAIDVFSQTNDWQQLAQTLAASDHITHFLMHEVDEKLSAAERRIMQAFALLAAPSSYDALEATLDEDIAAQTLDHLAERHLLTRILVGSQHLYSQHAMIQAFYEPRLGKRTRTPMHRRAAEYYSRDEIDHLRAGRHYLEAGVPEQAAIVLAQNAGGLINSGHARTVATLLARVSENQISGELWITTLLTRGRIALDLAEQHEALSFFEQALALLEHQESSPAVATQKGTIYGLMSTLLRSTDPERALELVDLAFTINPGLSMLDRGILLVRKGDISSLLGHHTLAVEYLTQSLAQLPPNALIWRAHALTFLGIDYCSTGHVIDGMRCYEEALTICEKTGNQWLSIDILVNSGIELDIGGRWIEAKTRYEEALHIAERLGRTESQQIVHLSIGILATKQGDDSAAKAHLQTAIHLGRRGQNKELLVASLSSSADLAIRQHDWSTVDTLLTEALALSATLLIQTQASEMYRNQSLRHIASGNIQAAKESAEKALHIARELGLVADEGMALRILAQVILESDQSNISRTEAYDHLAQSVELLNFDPYEGARTKLVWGQALLMHGDRETGSEYIHAALTIFAQLGAQRDFTLAESLKARL